MELYTSQNGRHWWFCCFQTTCNIILSTSIKIYICIYMIYCTYPFCFCNLSCGKIFIQEKKRGARRSRLRQHFLAQQFYRSAVWKGAPRSVCDVGLGCLLGMHYGSRSLALLKILCSKIRPENYVLLLCHKQESWKISNPFFFPVTMQDYKMLRVIPMEKEIQGLKVSTL